jgi:hypothetical protein
MAGSEEGKGMTGGDPRNMYGCTPCPKCRSVYRYPFTLRGPGLVHVIACDECGRRGPWDGQFGDDGYSVDERSPAIVREGKGVVEDPHGPGRSVLLCLSCGKLPPHTGSETLCPACAPPNGTCSCPGCDLAQTYRDRLEVLAEEADKFAATHDMSQPGHVADLHSLAEFARAAPPEAERTATPDMHRAMAALIFARHAEPAHADQWVTAAIDLLRGAGADAAAAPNEWIGAERAKLPAPSPSRPGPARETERRPWRARCAVCGVEVDTTIDAEWTCAATPPGWSHDARGMWRCSECGPSAPVDLAKSICAPEPTGTCSVKGRPHRKTPWCVDWRPAASAAVPDEDGGAP